MEFRSVFVSCEHGGNDVPEEYAPLFESAEELLRSHRGWDPGALPAARHIADRLGVPVQFAMVTRLLVDLNRGTSSPTLFSGLTRDLPPAEREAILERHYWPYRRRAEEEVRRLIRETGGPVLHLSIHSFTPVLHGVVRQTEMGLLYDPANRLERDFCGRMSRRLRASPMEWQVRSNYPYKGTGDGLILTLRRRFPESSYAGINIEFPQGLYLQNRERWDQLVLETGEALDRCRRPSRRSPGGKVPAP